jgi:hypothetical protein
MLAVPMSIDSRSTDMSTAPAVLPAARRPARLALILALLGLPGSTIAWGLPAGGFWIGMPLALAAVAVGVRCLSGTDQRGRRLAIAAIVLGAIEILFTAAWTVAG